MQQQSKTERVWGVGARATAFALLAIAVAVAAVAAWQAAAAQTPPSGAELEWVNQDEDWIERKKHGEFRARPIFNQRLATLYYGLRDSDTGEWLTAMYRVSGGEKERDEGWEYEFDYPALDEHEAIDPDKTYLMVMLAASARPRVSRPRPRSTPSSPCISREGCWAASCAPWTRTVGPRRPPAG